MRTQDCREKVDWLVAHCGLSEESKRELSEAWDFCECNPEISGLSTNALRPLIREKDPEIQAEAISAMRKA